MVSARRLTTSFGKNDEPVDVEVFYVCYRKDGDDMILYLVRADNNEEAIKAVYWENPKGLITCAGQYGIAEDKDGVVFACKKAGACNDIRT